MRNGLVGLVSAMVLASIVTACSSSGASGGKGGSSGGGGTVGTGGTVSTGGTSSGGGAGGGGGGSPVTTLSGSTALNALAPAEVIQLCDDTYAYFGSAIPKATACKWKGLAYGASSSAPSDAVLQQNCTSKESNCQQSADPWENNLGCNDIPSSCAATVAQYAACIGDEVATFIQLVNSFPMCTALVRSDASAILNAIASDPPASCASLMNTCPDLYPPGPLNQ